MAVIEIAKIQVRRGQENVTGIPQLDPGEFGWAEDTQNLYIGKRISEGASSDENTRVLTDKDLTNLMHVFGVGLTGSAASTSTYRYRDDLDYRYFSSTTTTIGHKLDELGVSLTDFSQSPLDDTDITDVLQRAIRDIYANSTYGENTVRTLKLPRGNFRVSTVINLPPNAKLEGEGPGQTVITLTSEGTSMFRTVDGLGNDFSTVMQTGALRARDISIKGMTLAYKANNKNQTPLISLDNVEFPSIENVEFTTENANLSGTFVGTGTSIQIRGNLSSDLSGVVTRNARIYDCSFRDMRYGVMCKGLVRNLELEDNHFNYLITGVVLTGPSIVVIPQYSLASGNSFDFIYSSAIVITTSTTRTSFLSTNNTYRNVGNRGTIADQNVVNPAYPVLQFNAPGCASANDRFHRQDAAESTSTMYYSPLANGYIRLQNDFTYNKNISALTYNLPVMKIPVTGSDQIVTVEYQLGNAHMSRKGKLLMNITPDGFASVSDDYNWNEVIDGTSEMFVFSTDMSKVSSLNFVSLTCSNYDSIDTLFEYIVHIST